MLLLDYGYNNFMPYLIKRTININIILRILYVQYGYHKLYNLVTNNR